MAIKVLIGLVVALVILIVCKGFEEAKQKKQKRVEQTRKSNDKWLRVAPPYQGLMRAIEAAANHCNDGLPLMRVSDDSRESRCPRCGVYAGRLVDVSRGEVIASRFPQAISLRRLLATGIFHDDCTHRLEYVSIEEIPDDIFKVVKPHIGKRGAFGLWTDTLIYALFRECKPFVDKAEYEARQED
jgi:hypothetical protein